MTASMFRVLSRVHIGSVAATQDNALRRAGTCVRQRIRCERSFTL